ncbi:hypothetical protein DVH24_038465 [Malus domestica]|uniref:Uncharacterized protein n=1 Tax=Malus domestica TaxID=3750 RepID=A0A498K9K5_MALDO|nr:hypothetical protein DVH24_038465 [Malus domestica]
MKLFAGPIDGSRKIVSRVVLKQYYEFYGGTTPPNPRNYYEISVFTIHQAEELYTEDMKKPFTHHGVA